MESLLPFEKEERKIIEKREAQTNKSYGKQPQERTIEELLESSVITINKPEGPTSHETVDFLKKILKSDKIGHGGTLDPHVTGVLPAALNKATKVTQALLPAGKEYVCLMHIHKEVTVQKIKATLEQFIGTITQLPPIRSAVKRQERERKIYYIKIMQIKDQDVLFRVGCQGGTYVRKMCHDIGEKLGTGAHMAQLIRTKAGPFNDKEMYTLHDIKDAYEEYKQGNEKKLKHILKPIETAVTHVPKIWITDETVGSVTHGAQLGIPGIVKLHNTIREGQLIAIMTLKDELVALAIAQKSSKEIKNNQKGLATKTQQVFLDRTTYPYKKRLH